MYIIQLKKSDIEEIKEELTNLKSLESFEGECDEETKENYGDYENYDFLAFNEKVDVESKKLEKIKTPDFYQKESWSYEVDMGENGGIEACVDIFWNGDRNGTVYSDYALDEDDFYGDAKILSMKHTPKVNWEEALKYLIKEQTTTIKKGEKITPPDHFFEAVAPCDVYIQEDSSSDTMKIFFEETCNKHNFHINYSPNQCSDLSKEQWETFVQSVDQKLVPFDMNEESYSGMMVEKYNQETQMLIIHQASKQRLLWVSMETHNYILYTPYFSGLLRTVNVGDDFDVLQQFIDSIQVGAMEKGNEYYKNVEVILEERAEAQRKAQEEEQKQIEKERKEEEESTPVADENTFCTIDNEIKIQVPNGFFYKENQTDQRQLVIINDVSYMHGDEIFDATNNISIAREENIFVSGLMVGQRAQMIIDQLLDHYSPNYELEVHSIAPGLSILLTTKDRNPKENFECAPALIVTPKKVYIVTSYLNGETSEEIEKARQWQHEFLLNNVALAHDDQLLSTNETVHFNISLVNETQEIRYSVEPSVKHAYYVREALKGLLLEAGRSVLGYPEDFVLSEIQEFNEMNDMFNVRMSIFEDETLRITLPIDSDPDLEGNCGSGSIIPVLAFGYQALDENKDMNFTIEYQFKDDLEDDFGPLE